MAHFSYNDNQLTVEGCTLSAIADTYDTPCYVYSRASIEQSYQAYASALGAHPGMICYAVKANSSLAVLQVLAQQGAGFDIVSQGELQRVLAAGGSADRVIFSGVGKKAEEMRFALQQQIACFNVESAAELETLAQVAQAMGTTARVSLRVNPDVDANTHPYISTGLKENKFGVDIQTALDVYRRAASLDGIDVVGIDCHIGSQLTQLAPFMDALDRVLALMDQLAEEGITIRHLDLGGGLGVTYNNEQPPSPADYVGQVIAKLGDRAVALMFEPGRSIVANAGVLLTRVLYLKPTEHKNFAIIDAAMNDNIRPSLYQAWQRVLPVIAPEESEPTQQWDLVGPVCETGDWLAKDRALALHEGSVLALMSSGAYGFTMSSNYNSRTRAAEIMVDGDKHHLIRARETFADLVRGEQLLGSEDPS
ncbi:diaminopimelate decarboxylase [Teredinibacter turnerae T7901]|uniref:Diaminopimelate decarboxylase n=1 Tax=Teredinibacter turnerae (strain ATCC 39867 / T7901) TaxID=377629 RepID=C5BUL5_TERTT|nr:diaminopimelate decarboxylase [Teredinibacter turnerae]ACR14417.1 diaminopimelate decarboxylase [Teredinibacter turnerae T7901]